MVWPRNARRQLPFGRRQVPFQTPPQLSQAPLELLRSHLYPAYPGIVGQAAQHVVQNGYQTVHWMPLRMGMQQWKKSSEGFYGPQAAGAEAFAGVLGQMMSNGPAMQTVRQYVPPHPSMGWDYMSAQLQAQMNVAYDGMPIRNPLGRDVPAPGYWPAQAFDTMDSFELYAAARGQRARRDARMAAMRRLRELDREYGQWTEPRYIDQTTGRRLY